MKKMNLKFFGLRAGMVLPLFLLIGLFLISANTASAQFLPKDEAVVALRLHLEATPEIAPSLNYDKDAMLTTEQAARDLAFQKRQYGEYMLILMDKYDKGVAEAIDLAVEAAEERNLPEDAIEAVKEEYVDLLSH